MWSNFQEMVLFNVDLHVVLISFGVLIGGAFLNEAIKNRKDKKNFAKQTAKLPTEVQVYDWATDGL